MKPRNAAIGVGVLALASLGAVAHYSTTARAFQGTTAAPATYSPSTYTNPSRDAVPGAPAIVPAEPLAGSTLATVPAAGAAATPVSERVVYRDRVVYRTRAAAQPRYVVHRRSKKHSAAIIGGSTVGGAGIGALVGGKKGALIGGLLGGGAGTVYDRKTHKKVVRE